MKRWSSREYSLMFVTLLVIMGYVFMRFIDPSVLFSSQQDEDGIVHKQEIFESYLEKLQSLSAIKDSETQLRDEFGMMDSKERQISSLISAVQDRAKEHQVQILNLQPRSPSETQQGVLFSIQMTIAGSWEAVLIWLDDLQRPPLHVAVSQLRLERDSGKDDGLKGRLSIEYFRMK